MYICVLGYIDIVQHKEHSPEILSLPPGTPCIWDKTTVNEKFNSNGQTFISHQLLDSSGSKSMEENAGCYNDTQLIHSFNEVVSLCSTAKTEHQHQQTFLQLHNLYFTDPLLELS